LWLHPQFKVFSGGLLSHPAIRNPIAASAAAIAKNLIFFILISLLRADKMAKPSAQNAAA